MRKILLITLAICTASCSNDDDQPVNQQINCDCDRVVQVSTFNVVGTPENPATNYYSIYTTINDCTQIQREKTFTTTNPQLSPTLGQCR